MDRYVIIGVDAPFSPTTEHVLQVAGSLLALATIPLRAVVLHVIPLPHIPVSKFGMTRIVPTAEQRAEAQQVLRKANLALQQRGIAAEQIEELIRSGIPAEEIIKVAKERDAEFILVGNRGNSLKEHMRRLLLGSTSQHIVKYATCSVVLATLPPASSSCDLVAWYKEAITQVLHERAPHLTILTASEAARLFAPSARTAGPQEIAATTLALEQLAGSGVLIAQHIDGEVRYVND